MDGNGETLTIPDAMVRQLPLNSGAYDQGAVTTAAESSAGAGPPRAHQLHGGGRKKSPSASGAATRGGGSARGLTHANGKCILGSGLMQIWPSAREQIAESAFPEKFS